MRLTSDPNVDRLQDELLDLLPPGDSPIRARAMGWKASHPRRQDSEMMAQAVAMAQRTGDADAIAGTLHSTVWFESGSPNAAAMLERGRGPLPDNQSAQPLPTC